MMTVNRIFILFLFALNLVACGGAAGDAESRTSSSQAIQASSSSLAASVTTSAQESSVNSRSSITASANASGASSSILKNSSASNRASSMPANLSSSSRSLSSATGSLSGNASSATLEENTPPVMTLIGESSLELIFKQDFVDPGAEAFDENDGNLTSAIEVTLGGLDSQVPGEYTLQYHVKNASGLTATLTRFVTVLENTPPNIELVGAASVSLSIGSNFNALTATAFDLEDGVVSVSANMTNLSSLTVGRHQITYTATDAEGLSASVNRTLIITALLGGNSHSMGMGLSGIADWSTQIPFIDLMKQSRGWRDWLNNTSLPFIENENGWITALNPGQAASTVFLVLQSNFLPFTKVVVFYEGEGELRYTSSARKINDESTFGRDVVSVGAGNHLLSIASTNTDNPIRNIRIIPEPYLDAYESGEIFNPVWLDRIKDFRALRFMDWMSTNNSTQSSWKDRPKPSHRTWRGKGVPLEVMLSLANRIGIDPWFTVPHLADQHYMQQFALLVKEQLSATRKVYVEHSNEVWNWGFEQAQYANTTGRARWGDVSNARMQWHGMRTAQLCDAFKLGAFTGQASRVKCVLGVQTVYHGLQEGAMECPKWVAEGNTPCYQHGFDYIAITSYFHGGLNGPAQISSEASIEQVATLKRWMSEADGGMNQAFEQLKFGTGLRHLERYADYKGIVDELRGEFDYWVGYAKGFNLGVAAYEGGQHISANGLALFDDDNVVAFHMGINRDPRMQQLYTSVLNEWKDSGAELHMHFVDIGSPGRYGSWGALEYLTQPTSPKWQAIVNFNRTVNCWWAGCGD